MPVYVCLYACICVSVCVYMCVWVRIQYLFQIEQRTQCILGQWQKGRNEQSLGLSRIPTLPTPMLQRHSLVYNTSRQWVLQRGVFLLLTPFPCISLSILSLSARREKNSLMRQTWCEEGNKRQGEAKLQGWSYVTFFIKKIVNWWSRSSYLSDKIPQNWYCSQLVGHLNKRGDGVFMNGGLKSRYYVTSLSLSFCRCPFSDSCSYLNVVKRGVWVSKR